MNNTWIFVVNSSRFPGILSTLQNAPESLDWGVYEHKEWLENAKGDVVFIYLAGTGIVAKATISGGAFPAKPGDAGWAPGERPNVEKQIELRDGKWIDKHRAITIAKLREILDPAGPFIKKNAQGFHFRLSEPEEAAIEKEWLSR